MTATAPVIDDWDQNPVDDYRRDQYGRPYILQPDGTRIGYTRSSTAAKTIDETYNLQRYDVRNVVYGLAYDASLVARTIAIGGNPGTWQKPEKDAVNGIADDARRVAHDYKKADIGSALHHMTHRVDRGEISNFGIYEDDITAYVNACIEARLEINPAYVECRIVNDLLRMAGSADRIVQHDGVWRIADIKTGASIEYGGLGWSAQLSAYAGGVLYDIATEQRLPTPPIDQTTGYIIHLPAGQGRCEIYEVDLVAGHRAAELANEIRAVRKAAKGWISPIQVAAPGVPPTPAVTAVTAAQPAPTPATPAAGVGAGTPGSPDAMPDEAGGRVGPPADLTPLQRGHDRPDEGGPADPWDIDDLQTDYQKLDNNGKSWVDQLVAEGNAAGVPWHPDGNPTMRRYHLGHAAVKLAADIPLTDDDIRALVVAATGNDTLETPLGHAIGSCDATTAATLHQLVDEYLK